MRATWKETGRGKPRNQECRTKLTCLAQKLGEVGLIERTRGNLCSFDGIQGLARKISPLAPPGRIAERIAVVRIEALHPGDVVADAFLPIVTAGVEESEVHSIQIPRWRFAIHDELNLPPNILHVPRHVDTGQLPRRLAPSFLMMGNQRLPSRTRIRGMLSHPEHVTECGREVHQHRLPFSPTSCRSAAGEAG